MAIDEEHVKNLKKSLDTFGQIYAIIVDETGDIINGRHRARAGAYHKEVVNTAELAHRLGVSQEAARILLRIHSNVQRKVSEDETREELLALAEAFEKQGIPKEKILEMLIKWVPYSERYIRELLPDEYKQKPKSPQELTEEEKKWLASIIDSCARIYRDKDGQLWIRISSADKSLVEKAAEILGTSVIEDDRVYRTARHGAKSIEELLRQIQPYLRDKEAVLKVLVSSADTSGTSSVCIRNKKGADTQVSPPVAEKPTPQITEPKAEEGLGQEGSTASPASEKPSEKPQTPQPTLPRFNPAASNMVRMLKDGIEGGLFTWKEILGAMDLVMTLSLAAAYRETLTPGSQCPVCGAVVGPNDVYAGLKFLEARWGRGSG